MEYNCLQSIYILDSSVFDHMESGHIYLHMISYYDDIQKTNSDAVPSSDFAKRQVRALQAEG